jgi:hypothetical protein
LARHLQIDSDPVPDPAEHFDADLDFFDGMPIQVIKMMWIHADPDLQD